MALKSAQYQVLIADEYEDVIFVGNNKEVCEFIGIIERHLSRIVNKGMLVHNKYNITKVDRDYSIKLKKTLLYAVSKADKYEFIQLIGNIDEVCEFLKVPKSKVWENASNGSAIGDKYYVFTINKDER